LAALPQSNRERIAALISARGGRGNTLRSGHDLEMEDIINKNNYDWDIKYWHICFGGNTTQSNSWCRYLVCINQKYCQWKKSRLNLKQK
jgi:hypothetical protein